MSPSRSRRLLVGLLVGLPTSAVFLWLAVRNADLALVRRTLADADLGFVASAVGAVAGIYAFQTLRWRRIAAASQVSLPRVYEMVVSGAACNNVLPIRLGDVMRARWLGREAGIPAGRAFGTVVIDRACDLAVLVALLVFGIATVASSDWLLYLALGGVLVLAALGAAVLLARLYIARRLRDRHPRGLLRRMLRDTIEELAEPRGRRRLAGWLMLSFAAWAMWALGALLVARALGIDLGPGDALFVAAVVNLGSAIPSSPGYVGTYEWLGVASLALVGVPREEALAFAILLHATWYVPTTLAGGLAIGARMRSASRRSRAAPEMKAR
jgi:uncharacterized protein (TIRG00374 family)